MSVSLLLQYTVIALAVIISAWVVAKKQFPGTVRKLRIALAVPLLREARPAWLRTLGRKIAPEAKKPSGSCGGCDNCGD
ncbi:MAG: hypothetical protein QM769_08795 [Pseudoxanthomonas sp.]